MAKEKKPTLTQQVNNLRIRLEALEKDFNAFFQEFNKSGRIIKPDTTAGASLPGKGTRYGE